MLEVREIKQQIQRFYNDFSETNGKHRDRSPLKICYEIIQCLDSVKKRPPYWTMLEFLEECNSEEIQYIISIIYSILIGKERRKSLGAYFTPPYIVKHIISKLIRYGFDPINDTVLDPASGGAAFLSPVARVMVNACKQEGISSKNALLSVEQRLYGIEIDKELANLCKHLLSFELREEFRAAGSIKPSIIVRDSLSLTSPPCKVDVIMGNPPYGRIFSKSIPTLLTNIIVNNYVNRYAAFLKLSTDWVRPGGLIGFVIPTSFIGGPYYRKLREFLLIETEILCIDLIVNRENLFFDSIQDICILILRKKEGKKQRRASYKRPRVALINTDGRKGSVKKVGTAIIPKSLCGDEWSVPHDNGSNLIFPRRFISLKDLGYNLKVGAFVWNREKEKLREGKKPVEGEYPLLWASAIRPNGTFFLRGKMSSEYLSFIMVPLAKSPIIIRHPAVIVQRTSNKTQPRRLNAAVVPQSLIDHYKGYVCENHVIAIYPVTKKPKMSIIKLCKIINSSCIDNIFRAISGTVSVSATVLRRMPFPEPKVLEKALQRTNSLDKAIEMAFFK